MELSVQAKLGPFDYWSCLGSEARRVRAIGSTNHLKCNNNVNSRSTIVPQASRRVVMLSDWPSR